MDYGGGVIFSDLLVAIGLPERAVMRRGASTFALSRTALKADPMLQSKG
jgi:hypothetical protein